ncbi:uncharacterized protein LOC125261182 [Megalobrama amblycephala]|uniref:uncharacterized protein LOC125261182 n=1 Tax=Megalobrama amblycephala TaxID=75352 RepID=UPI002013EBE7|nr:uncharacterized protein LOC125261182 [Megalobrama amblycephala]
MFKEKYFVFFWLCFCHLVGVFADELKSVSVMEGDSVTLQINVTELQTDDEIAWTFGTNRSLIAEIKGMPSKISIYNGPDGIFRNRLKLDKKTGSLTITDIRTEHAGDYEADISLRSSSPKYIFNVTVYAATTTKPPSTSRSPLRSPEVTSHTSASSGSILAVQISSAAAGFLLIVASVGIFYTCRKQRKTDQQGKCYLLLKHL